MEMSTATKEEVDVLVITYNRPIYTRMALERLLETADASTRVWIWHNGEHPETLGVVRELAEHPRVHRLHHSRENVRLREPTNWLLAEARGAFLSKVDDDCLVPRGWLDTLRAAHQAEPRLGVVGCWRFLESDFVPELASRKIQPIGGGHALLRHPWVEGSGFLMKRRCVEEAGPLGPTESFTGYCLRLARAGWMNGWYHPFLWQEHLDDPRAPHSLLRTDEDFRRHRPLSATTFGAGSLAEWDARLRRSARLLQEQPWQVKYYVGWRRWLERGAARLRALRRRRAGAGALR